MPTVSSRSRRSDRDYRLFEVVRISPTGERRHGPIMGPSDLFAFLKQYNKFTYLTGWRAEALERALVPMTEGGAV